MTIARQLAAFCCRTAEQPLPAAVAAHARLCVADHLHAAMHGARSETAVLLARYLDLQREPGLAGAGAEATALFLGTLSAVHEIDDVHQDTSLHTGSFVVAAALAAGAHAGVSGARLLAAVAAGYEVAVRLSIAAGHRHYHYFHATATCGAVGAAAATAVIYALSEDQTAHAIGFAVTSASGLWEGINDEAVTVKHLHPGLAAERGVRAAALARLGLRAAERSIEGDKGFLAALAQPGAHAPAETPDTAASAEILLAGLGERWALTRNLFKRYPFCLGCFEPLEGLRHILGGSTRAAGDVDTVRIELSRPTAWMVGQPDPRDQFQAKFSAPYALALVLAGHDAERAPMPADLLVDPVVRDWIARVRVEANPEFARRRARVTVAWKDGGSETTEQPFRNLDPAAVWKRFAAACRQYLGERGPLLESQIEGCAALSDVSVVMPLVRAATGY